MLEQLSTELHALLPFDKVIKAELIQSLWSGYGQLYRVYLKGSAHKSIVVKRISPPGNVQHPHGWKTNIGHERKLQSYKVEQHWYQNYAGLVNEDSLVPQLLGFSKSETASLLVLEDLSVFGFSLQKSVLNQQEIKNCLSWLGHFHGQFMQEQLKGLWPIGTYWHLDTRREEWEAMPNGALKDGAQKIADQLNNAAFKTVVHGDAKYANFCFSSLGSLGAVDFQYVGSGCGMKDVAYLFSCFPNGMPSPVVEQDLLNHYFSALEKSLKMYHPLLDFSEIRKEWMYLYPFAWADFERFLQGWSPGHWKISEYSQNMVKKTLKLL